jgi:hypothetical protein
MTRTIITLVALAVLPLGTQAAEAVKVGDEITLLADGPGKDIRGTPHVAFGKGIYLAVWREGFSGEGGIARIYAVRLDKQGKALDPKPIQVAPCKDGFQELPRVAFGGGVFLVVWQDFRNGKDYDVLGARIAPEGKVLDAQPLTIAVGPRTQSVPDAASDGEDLLVVCQAVRGEENVYRVLAAPIDADGRIDAAVEIENPWSRGGASPRIVWDGTNYRLVFVAQSLLSIQLSPDGNPVEKGPVVALRQHLGAAIRFSHSVAAAPGQGMLAVLTRSQPDYWGWGGPGAMICLLVGMDGKLDTTIPREDYPQSKLANWLDFGKDKRENSPWPYGQSAVAWDGRQFVAVWQRQHITKTVSLTNSDILISRVDGWKPLDTDGVPVAVTELEEKNPALASDGAGSLLCVYEKHDKSGKVAIVARVLQSW